MSASTVTTPSPTAGVPLPQSLVSLVPGKHPELESTGLRHPIDDLTAFRLERFISDAKSRCGDPILSAQATLLLHESLARRMPSAAREPTDISAQLAAMESRLQAHLDLSISALKESVGALKMSIDDLRGEVHLGFDQTRQQTAQLINDTRSHAPGYDGRLVVVPGVNKPNGMLHPTALRPAAQKLSSVHVVQDLTERELGLWLRFYGKEAEGNRAADRKNLLAFLHGEP